MSTTIAMLAPDGTSGEIPIDKIDAAKQAGFKVAVQMKSPEGQNGYIPADRVHDAAAKGFKMVPLQAPDAAKASYWDALTNPIGSGGQEQGVLGAIKQVGGQAIKAAVQPVVHPLDTAAAIYNTVRHPIDTAVGMANQVKNDYQQGGVPLAVENIAGQAIGAVESGRIAAPVVRSAVNALPAGAGRAVLLGKTPEAAYESALKPSTAISQPERAAIVQTGLANSLPISKAGVEKLGDLIDEIEQQKTAHIQANPGRTVDPNAVATRADIAKAKFTNQVNAQGDLGAIEASKQQFLKEQGAPTNAQGDITGPAPAMTAENAQAMKSGTYRVLAGKYGEQGSAAVEAQKALARGLKEEIATQFPEISGLNTAESKLLDLQPVLERAVNRISNHQIIGIGTPVAGAAASAVTGSTTIGKVAMVAKAVLDNPNVKSRLAIAVSKGGKIPYSQALSRVQAYAASLGSLTSVGQENSTSGNPNPAANPAQ